MCKAQLQAPNSATHTAVFNCFISPRASPLASWPLNVLLYSSVNNLCPPGVCRSTVAMKFSWAIESIIAFTATNLIYKIFHYSYLSSESCETEIRLSDIAWHATHCNQVALFYFSPNGGPVIGQLSLYCTILSQEWVRIRVSKNVTKFALILRVTLSLLGIHFVASDYWLVSRAPTKLFVFYCLVQSFHGVTYLELPILPSYLYHCCPSFLEDGFTRYRILG